MLASPSFHSYIKLLTILVALKIAEVRAFSARSPALAPKSSLRVDCCPNLFSSRKQSHLLTTPKNDSDEIATSMWTPLDRPLLAMVDLASLVTFSAVGKASHAADGSIDVGAVALVALPFVSAWFLTSPFTGVYAPDDRDTNLVKDAFFKAGKGWIVAVPLGCVLRGVIKGYVPPVPFVLVTLVATLVIIGGARVLFAVAEDFFVELVN